MLKVIKIILILNSIVYFKLRKNWLQQEKVQGKIAFAIILVQLR